MRRYGTVLLQYVNVLSNSCLCFSGDDSGNLNLYKINVNLPSYGAGQSSHTPLITEVRVSLFFRFTSPPPFFMTSFSIQFSRLFSCAHGLVHILREP